MIENVKPIESLRVLDIQFHPVWEYADGEGGDETYVRPVGPLPATNLTGKIVGTQVTLANGRYVWALIGNVDASSARLTEHFVTLSVLHGDRWFTLARYHDFDYAERGPEALANFLALSVDEVFPIAYDIQQYATGEIAALKGQILKEPRERLTRSEIITMAVP
jgi:hypothetical protein